jgi:hypothetical protein
MHYSSTIFLLFFDCRFLSETRIVARTKVAAQKALRNPKKGKRINRLREDQSKTVCTVVVRAADVVKSISTMLTRAANVCRLISTVNAGAADCHKLAFTRLTKVEKETN